MKYNFSKDKTYLITGGTGFLGKELIKRLNQYGVNIRVLSRNEGKLIELKQEFPNVEILTGDIADPISIKQAMNNVHGVFHLAASKHVGLAEQLSRECIKTNTIGSLNILEESTIQPQLEFVIGISTDKAAQVSGVYGASKFLMERLFKQFENINPLGCDYRIVRYGNVLYSTGSVLCKWKELIQQEKSITITDPKATRFYWTVKQAVDLIFQCLENSSDTTPYVPEMKAMSLENLSKAMIQKYAHSNILVNQIGLQPGDNMHEKILENGPYSNEVEQYTIDEIKELI